MFIADAHFIQKSKAKEDRQAALAKTRMFVMPSQTNTTNSSQPAIFKKQNRHNKHTQRKDQRRKRMSVQALVGLEAQVDERRTDGVGGSGLALLVSN